MSKPLFVVGCVAALLLAGAASAVQARPVVSVDIGIGLPVFGGGYYGGYYRGPYGGYYGRRGGVWLQPGWGPQVIFAGPPLVYAVPAVPAPVVEPAPVSVPANRPDPVIYPRNAQSAQQTEADRQECNRWAVTQPTALADAAVFQRAVEACMDGRGYTVR
jgi:hypothetical protein